MRILIDPCPAYASASVSLHPPRSPIQPWILGTSATNLVDPGSARKGARINLATASRAADCPHTRLRGYSLPQLVRSVSRPGLVQVREV